MYRCGRKEISLGSGKVWVWAAWNIDDDQVIAVPVSSTGAALMIGYFLRE